MTVFHQEGELKAPHACDTECAPRPGNAPKQNRCVSFTRYKWIQRYRISLKCLPLSNICTEYEISVW